VGVRNAAARFESPTAGEIEAIAGAEQLELAPGELGPLRRLVSALVAAADRAESFSELEIELRHGRRDAGRRPLPEEDEFNAVIRTCRVEGAASGPLAGLTVGLKDNIAVAGVPMTNGSRLEPHTPTVDAVVTERLLDAGATIVAKLNMDDFAGGATGVMSAFGPARNPVDPSRSAGGSSGGAGAAVRAGIVDAALGVDQGGSGRIPAAFCGVVAIKATHGLVPTFGVSHIDHTIDFVTPLAQTVDRVALLLEVLAGGDWRDPQWVRGELATARYTDAAGDGVSGLRAGVVRESVDGTECEPAVVEGLARCAERLRASGARVEEISIPEWLRGFATFQPYVAHLVANMLRSEGVGYGHLGYIDAGRMRAFAVARRAQSRLLNPYVKAWLLTDGYLRQKYPGRSFATLHNQRLLLRRAFDDALREFDLLLTPTIPIVATPLPPAHATLDELLDDSRECICYNTAPLNLSGHPALTLPSGTDEEGLPTGVQLIGRNFDEYTVFRAAFELERCAVPTPARPGAGPPLEPPPSAG
jgi:amidase